MPESAESADAVFLNLSCYWLDQLTKNIAKSFSLMMLTNGKNRILPRVLFISLGRIPLLDPFFHSQNGYHPDNVTGELDSTLHFISMCALTSEFNDVQSYETGKTYASYAGVMFPSLQKYLLINLQEILYDKQLAYTHKLSTRR